jgi:formylglycine-generating enzyme required for sulfatase activity
MIGNSMPKVYLFRALPLHISQNFIVTHRYDELIGTRENEHFVTDQQIVQHIREEVVRKHVGKAFWLKDIIIEKRYGSPELAHLKDERLVQEKKNIIERQNFLREQEIAEEEKLATVKVEQDRIVREAKAQAEKKMCQQEVVKRIKNVFRSRVRLPFTIGGGIVILFLLGFIIKNVVFPSMPSLPTETSRTLSLPFAASTKIPPTTTLTSTDVPTEIPITSTPTLGVGSTMISEKDGMLMMYVPVGEFQMGSENGDSDEKPIHMVDLDAFWIDQTEVTNAMYGKCIEAGSCNSPTNTKYYTNPAYKNHPVVFVNWNDASTYCGWVDRRLPTEAEWEKAASWDEDMLVQRTYPWGNSFDGTKLNFCDVNCTSEWKNLDYDDGFIDTSPVANYLSGKSFYGAYDMAGNVWEWVADWYNAYPGSFENASKDFGMSHRVLRGGAWYSNDKNTRSANRFGEYPSNAEDSFGFRCARDAD